MDNHFLLKLSESIKIWNLYLNSELIKDQSSWEKIFLQVPNKILLTGMNHNDIWEVTIKIIVTCSNNNKYYNAISTARMYKCMHGLDPYMRSL